MSNNRKNVYIVFNDGNRDFYKAERFGNLVSVIDGSYDSQYRNPKALIEYIEERMGDFNDGDYILMIGEPTLCALVVNVAVSLSMSKRLNILRWDKVDMDYKTVTVDFSSIKFREHQADFNI